MRGACRSGEGPQQAAMLLKLQMVQTPAGLDSAMCMQQACMNNKTTSCAHAVKGSEDVRHHTCSTRGCGAATRAMRRGAAPMLAVAYRIQEGTSPPGLTLRHAPPQPGLRWAWLQLRMSCPDSGPRSAGAAHFAMLVSRHAPGGRRGRWARSRPPSAASGPWPAPRRWRAGSCATPQS